MMGLGMSPSKYLSRSSTKVVIVPAVICKQLFYQNTVKSIKNTRKRDNAQPSALNFVAVTF